MDNNDLSAALDRIEAEHTECVCGMLAPHCHCGAEWPCDKGRLAAVVQAVLGVHRPAYNDAEASPICPECQGKAGVWPCGCWRDEDVEPVCAVCTDRDPVYGRVGRSDWPCATVRAATKAWEDGR